ncbi:hypothetical protein HHI36_000408 [Cryptolaemus montrouzieri]|uniref:Ionotropic receptor n=1 Tax=Cryptolaemus montrouzieri TaxID=559131 RepID=A0ABD2P4U0_9CUCU
MVSYYVVNVIFLNTDSGMLETFFPFEQADFHHTNTNLRVIGECSASGLVEYHDLFPNKIPEKWKNSTITYCYIPIEPGAFENDKKKGFAIEIHSLILERMGATPNGTKTRNLRWGVEIMRQTLVSRYCDFSVSAMGHDAFDLTYPYHLAEMYWFVPSPAINQNYNFILGTFTTSVWLICLGTILAVALFWYFLGHFLEEEHGTFLEKIVLTFMLLLEQGIELNILRKSEFILYTILIFSTFMMGNIYKSKLLYVLSGQHYEETITTEEGIMEHNLKIGLLPLYIQFFQDHENFVAYMRKNYISCGIDTTCEDMVAFARNTAVLRPTIVTDYHDKRYIGEDGRLKRIKFPKSTTFIYYTCYFLPGQPIYEQVNQYTHRLLQNGIVSKCITGILENYTNPGSYIAKVNSEYEFDVPMVQIRGSPTEITSFTSSKFDFFIIDLDKTNILEFLQLFHEAPNFHASSKFLCIGGNISSNSLKIIASYYIVNVIFLDKESGVLETFFPFEKANLHHSNTNLQVIGKCSECSVDYHDLFPNKLPKKWKNSNITFCHNGNEPMGFANDANKGIATEIHRLILMRMGATPNSTVIKANINSSRLAFRKKILKLKLCDFYISGFVDSTLDLGFPFYIDLIYWFVPSPAINENYNFILGTLSTSVWLVWFTALICLALYWKFLCYLRNKTQNSFLGKFLSIFKMFLEETVKFKILSNSDFILYTIIIFGTFMMGSIYKGRILYVLSGFHYEETISSEESIMKHNFKIGFLPNHLRWFRDQKKFFEYISKHHQPCGFDVKCEDQVAFERNMTVLRPLLITEYRNKRYIGEDGRLKRIRLPNPTMFTYYIALFLPGQPILKQINQYTHYLYQNGIISMIISKYSVETPEQSMNFHRSVLTMQHLKLVFVLWLVGLIAACVIFSLEITRSFG